MFILIALSIVIGYIVYRLAMPKLTVHDIEQSFGADQAASEVVLSGYGLTSNSSHIRITDLTVAAPSIGNVKEQYYVVRCDHDGMHGEILCWIPALHTLTQDMLRPADKAIHIIDSQFRIMATAPGSYFDFDGDHIPDLIITCPECLGFGKSIHMPCLTCSNSRITTLYKFINTQR